MSLDLSLILSEYGHATFSELEHTYPVTCVISDLTEKTSKLAYIGSFGGGMVSGDQFTYDLLIGKSTKLYIRNTSSTKIFKRIGERSTCQTYNISLEEDSYLCMIPEPLVCFKDSIYSQKFTIHLTDSSNLIFLDWFSCGRSTMEKWEFQSLSSSLLILLNRETILTDNLKLENSLLSIESRMGNYEIFATLILIGPETLKSQNHIWNLKKSLQVLWYCSKLPKCQGLIVKLAGLNRESLQDFIKEQLFESSVIKYAWD